MITPDLAKVVGSISVRAWDMTSLKVQRHRRVAVPLVQQDLVYRYVCAVAAWLLGAKPLLQSLLVYFLDYRWMQVKVSAHCFDCVAQFHPLFHQGPQVLGHPMPFILERYSLHVQVPSSPASDAHMLKRHLMLLVDVLLPAAFRAYPGQFLGYSPYGEHHLMPVHPCDCNGFLHYIEACETMGDCGSVLHRDGYPFGFSVVT
jgi:hypothetical protein